MTSHNQQSQQHELCEADLDDHVIMYSVGVIKVQQYSLSKGLQLFRKMGRQSAMSKLTQLHDRSTYYLVHAHELTKQQRLDALSSLTSHKNAMDGSKEGRV